MPVSAFISASSLAACQVVVGPFLYVYRRHLVDSQSFATCSDNFPALCKQGAYPNGYSASEAESSPTRNVSKARYAI